MADTGTGLGADVGIDPTVPRKNQPFDTRAILALISITGAFVYQGLLLWVSRHQLASELPQIPSWMSAITMGVIGFYFGARAADNGNGNGHK